MANSIVLGRRGFLALIAVSAAAQTASNPGNAPQPAIGSMWFTTGPGNPMPGGVTGHPYSAEQITERVQTLADGTHITQGSQKTLMYRDSAGRTRTEHSFPTPPGMVMAAIPSTVQIMDPVAGYHYFLNTQNNTANRSALPQSRGGRAVAAAASPTGARVPVPAITVTLPNSAPATTSANSNPRSGRPRPQIQHESLGTDTIEGLVAEGTRTTVTYPEGTMGNDRPITTVSETWTSPDLKVMVLSKTSDPRSGESTTKLINISQSEPDPALFQVPPDYQIVDQQ